MCLSAVKLIYDAPTPKHLVRRGYKIFEVVDGLLCGEFRGKKWNERKPGKWLHEKDYRDTMFDTIKIPEVSDPGSEEPQYPKGWHYFTNLKDALYWKESADRMNKRANLTKFLTIRKIKARGIVAEGTQMKRGPEAENSSRCNIAKEIFIGESLDVKTIRL